MEKSLDQYFTAILGVEDSNPAEYSGLALAYIGDSVFDLLVKTVLVSKDNKQAFKYHKEAIHIVNAESQAGYIDLLEEKLTEQEMAIYKRGRNTKTHSKAKNALVGQYRKATGSGVPQRTQRQIIHHREKRFRGRLPQSYRF